MSDEGKGVNELTGLVAYRYDDGSVVCIDCDVYPPHTTDIRENDVTGEVADEVCRRCGQSLREVIPLTSLQ